MRISIAQTRPVKGDIECNLSAHLKYIETGVAENVDLIVFPELSLTGYEPALAKGLATTKDDFRLDPLQQISDANKITIGVGLPTKEGEETLISMVIIRPKLERIAYSKQYLYPTEVEIFGSGNNPLVLNFENGCVVAPAICYETSVSQHQEFAYANSARFYVASVLNSVGGVKSDLERLSAIARNYEMTAFMSNYVGVSGGYECAGLSSVWGKNGEIIAQMDGTSEGQIIYDTESEVALLKYHETQHRGGSSSGF